jgi:mono/diheme cytochrome c family protein
MRFTSIATGTLTRALGAVLLLAAWTIPAPAQDTVRAAATPASVKSALDGAYSDSQATRGERLYRTHCSSCHTAQNHSGPDFQQQWTGRTAYDLFEIIRTTMPLDDPGRLGRQEYADILAYLLKLNGYPAGTEPLASDNERLRRVRIEARPRER